MRILGFVGLAMLAGCAVLTPPVPTTTPEPSASPKAKATPVASRAEDLVGVWGSYSIGTERVAPVKHEKCSSLSRHSFRLAPDGGLTLNIEGYRSTPITPYNRSRLTGKLDPDGKTWRFEGVRIVPVGDGSTTAEEPESYVLVHSPARSRLEGTRTSVNVAIPVQPVLLLKTDLPLDTPWEGIGCQPLPTPQPTPTPVEGQ